MERYLTEMMARNQEFDFYLDRQFDMMDKKDQAFIEEMKRVQYESPQKEKEKRDTIARVETKMKMRKQII